ncbi:MAG: glycosyltransferase family 2 protein [Vulcanimicrobiota bacterium]
MLLSIIVPVFNEETSVIEVVQRLLALPLPEGLTTEIIVVDDGSTDGTTRILEGLSENPALKIHYSVLNFGKGVAVRVGLRYAQGDIVAIQDADLEYDPNHLLKLIEPIMEGRCQVVYGSRYLGVNQGMVVLQNLGNRILTAFTNILYGTRLTDTYTCYKIMSREVASQLSRVMTCRGFELEAEMTARLLLMGHKPLELPIRYLARSRSQGKKIRPRDGFKGLWWLLRIKLFGA